MLLRNSRDLLAFHIFDLRMGGAQANTMRLVNALSDRGWPVELVLTELAGPILDNLSSRVSVVALDRRSTPLPRPSSFRALREGRATRALTDYLDQRRPAFFFSAANHVHLSSILAHGMSAQNGRLILRITNAIRRPQVPVWTSRSLFTAAARRFYPKADQLVAVSQGLVSDLTARNGLRIPVQKVRYIQEPVIAPAFDQTLRQPPAHPWFHDKSVPVIIGAGRLAAQKDFETLLRAFAIVRRQKPLRLVIFGDGPERPRLDRLTRELRIAADVDMPGFTSELPAYFSAARLFVLSSAWEGLGSVVVEALAAGCPVASTDCAFGPREILNDGAYGSLAPCQNPAALAEAILRELNTTRNKDQLIYRALHYGVEESLSAYERLIGDLMRQDSLPQLSAA